MGVTSGEKENLKFLWSLGIAIYKISIYLSDIDSFGSKINPIYHRLKNLCFLQVRASSDPSPDFSEVTVDIDLELHALIPWHQVSLKKQKFLCWRQRFADNIIKFHRSTTKLGIFSKIDILGVENEL